MMIVTMTVTAEESVQRLKNRHRKRKSYSSADKMLSFLQSYTDRKDKAEEKKIKLLRADYRIVQLHRFSTFPSRCRTFWKCEKLNILTVTENN